MIDFDYFRYAAPPRAGTAWFCQAAAAVGLKQPGRTKVHIPHTRDGIQYRVTTIRHPCDWLASYYGTIHGVVGVPVVDKFHDLRRAYTFEDFVRQYLKRMPGKIGRMFESYGADTCIRLEDLPLAFIEFAIGLGIKEPIAKRAGIIAPANRNIRRLPTWTPQLYECVREAESPFIERYGYHGRRRGDCDSLPAPLDSATG